MGKTVFETLIGAVVLAVAAFFLLVAYRGGKSDERKSDSYFAKFDRIDGLRVSSDVRVSGLPVGKVTVQEIEPESYLAKVTFTIDNTVKIPSDSFAEIVSDGLLGNKYLSIVPGGSDSFLKPGDRIKYTQPAISLESLIGKFVFGGAQDQDAKKGEPKKDLSEQNAPAAKPDSARPSGKKGAPSEDDVFKTP